GLLNSPHFLYRTEIGAPDDEESETFGLTNHEVASLLSFSLLDKPPPEWLMVAADAGELTTQATLTTHVQRLLGEAGALDQLHRFLNQSLEIGHFEQVTKFEDRFPGFEEVREAMAEETANFLAQYGTTDNSFAQLLL